MKHTVKEVRAIAKRLHDDITVRDDHALKASAMLTAYAERIKADESAEVRLADYLKSQSGYVCLNDQARRNVANTFLAVAYPDHPPAQAAMVDLRNSLLRGKAQNEEPRVRHSCNIGVGCEETGICYAEANGQPEQCGRPTAEPAQPADSGRVWDISRLTRYFPSMPSHPGWKMTPDSCGEWVMFRDVQALAAPSAIKGGA